MPSPAPPHHQVETLPLVDALGDLRHPRQQGADPGQRQGWIHGRFQAIVGAGFQRLGHQFLAPLRRHHDDGQHRGTHRFAQPGDHAQRFVGCRIGEQDQQRLLAIFQLAFRLDQIDDPLGRQRRFLQRCTEIVQRRAVAGQDDGLGHGVSLAV